MLRLRPGDDRAHVARLPRARGRRRRDGKTHGESLRHPQLDARAADIRELPFEDGAFDAVVSNSTLDHFPSRAEIAASLREINRVLRPGGMLLVTLDNGMNPVIAARNAMPQRRRDATHLVPYEVGATCRRPRDLRVLLAETGFASTPRPMEGVHPAGPAQ